MCHNIFAYLRWLLITDGSRDAIWCCAPRCLILLCFSCEGIFISDWNNCFRNTMIASNKNMNILAAIPVLVLNSLFVHVKWMMQSVNIKETNWTKKYDWRSDEKKSIKLWSAPLRKKKKSFCSVLSTERFGTPPESTSTCVLAFIPGTSCAAWSACGSGSTTCGHMTWRWPTTWRQAACQGRPYFLLLNENKTFYCSLQIPAVVVWLESWKDIAARLPV